MAEKRQMELIHQAGDLDSEFEFDQEAHKKRKKYEDLSQKERKVKSAKGHKREVEAEYNKEEGRIMRHRIVSMDAFDRHKLLINNYLMYYSGSASHFKRDTSKDKTDIDIIRENHKFLWSDEDNPDETWAKRLAKKYYDKLFKEYCIADLSRYKENKIAMRWRIEREVEQGKGQFICGNKKCSESESLRSWEVNFAYMEDGAKKNALVKLRQFICGNKKCSESESLRSWEVNFAYMEDGAKKNALVKLRLCPDCSYKLNYRHRKKEVLPKKKQKDRSEEKPSSSEPQDNRTTEDSHTQQRTEKGDNLDEPGTSKEESSSIWSGPAKITEEKSREEEFDEYFADMFL